MQCRTLSVVAERSPAVYCKFLEVSTVEIALKMKFQPLKFQPLKMCDAVLSHRGSATHTNSVIGWLPCTSRSDVHVQCDA
jgi:hypothetical protein